MGYRRSTLATRSPSSAAARSWSATRISSPPCRVRLHLMPAARFDVEDSPKGDVSAHQPADISREERRFLIGTGDAQRTALAGDGIPLLRTYRVTTLYM